MSFLLDMMYGLRAIHNVGMIHGDLKPLNLLVTLGGRVKVADFGLSKVLGGVSLVPGTNTITGTPQYMAPEVILCQSQSLRVDMYSVGVIMWEVMAGVIPWRELDYVQIVQRVTRPSNETEAALAQARPQIDYVYHALAPSGYIHLLQSCWAQDSRCRPSADVCISGLIEIKAQCADLQQHHAPASVPCHAWTQGARQAPSLASHVRPIYNAMRGGSHFRQQATCAQQEKRASEHRQDKMPDHGDKRQRFDAFDGHAHNGGHRADHDEYQAHQELQPSHKGKASCGLHMPAMIDELKSGERSRVLVALASIIELLLGDPDQQRAFFGAGYVTYVLVYLHSDDQPELHSQAAKCLAVAMSQNLHCRQWVASVGAIPVLVRLLSRDPMQQEAASHALANLVKRPTEREHQMLRDSDELAHTKMALVAAQQELHRLGGMEKLVQLMERGSSRVRSAACAAVANAMTDCSGNRAAFQEANGVYQLVRLLREGDCHAQETAATALWNAMVDNPAAIKQFSEANGHECLLMLLNMGSDLGKELAAGAIWKVCAADDSGKTQYTAAVGGLVRLLRSEQESSHEQAAGALRSICVSSPQNKLELNRVNGIGALVTTLFSSSQTAAEQAGAALANACANCMANQIAARHAGAITVLVQVLTRGDSENLVACCVCAIRNLCTNCVEHQEELSRRNGLVPLMQLLHRSTKPQLLEYVASAVLKACSLCKDNLEVLRVQYGTGALKWILADDNATSQTKEYVKGLMDSLARFQPPLTKG